MEKIQPQQKVLPEEEPLRGVPVRNGPFRLLPLPPRVGPVEPTVSGIRGPRMRPSHHSGRHPTTLPIIRPLAHHLPHGTPEGHPQALTHPRPRSIH